MQARSAEEPAMKPLVFVVAMLLGLGALVATITIQQNPYAFTRLNRVEWTIERDVDVPVRAIELPVAIDGSFTLRARAIELDDVTIEGRLPAKARARPAAVAKADDELQIEFTILPAPCNDGEYRMLDEHRGVRVMCPGGSL